MSLKLQTWLCFIGTALVLMLYQSGLVWINFSPMSQMQQAQVDFLAEQLGESLENSEKTKINRLIDQYPFPLIITDTERDPLTSNLTSKNNQRGALAREALKQTSWRGPVRIAGGNGHIFYQPKEDTFLLQLMGPALGSLFWGGLIAFFFHLFNEKIIQQNTTIAEMTAYSELNPVAKLETRVVDLEQRNQYLTDKNQQLTYQIHQQTAQINKLKQGAHPDTKEEIVPRPVDESHLQVGKLRQELKRTQEQLSTLEQLYEHLKIKYEDAQKHVRNLQQDLKDQQEQGLKTEREQTLSAKLLAEKTHLMQQMEAQLEEATPLLAQLYTLQQAHDAWVLKEQKWTHEKEHFLTDITEKNDLLVDKEGKINEQKLKLKELSTALKKHMELVQLIPVDLQDAQHKITQLVEQKDVIEHQNIELQLETTTRLSEINLLKRDVADKQKRLNEYSYQMQTTEKDLDKLRQELQRLGHTLSHKLDEIELLNSDKDLNAQKIQQLLMERDQDKQAFIELQDQLQLSKLHVQQLLFDKERLTEQIEQFESAQYEFKIQQLSRSLQMINADQQKKNEQIKKLTEQARYAVQLGERLKQDNERKEERLSHVQQELHKAQSRLQMLKKKLQENEAPLLIPETDVSVIPAPENS